MSDRKCPVCGGTMTFYSRDAEYACAVDGHCLVVLKSDQETYADRLAARIAELEKDTMVRWRTIIETPVGVDEEFHTNLDAAEEYIGMCALDRPSTITKCEIREVKNE